MPRTIEAQPIRTKLYPEPSIDLADMPLGLLEEEKKPILVVKFGGYAMGTVENIQKSAEILHADPEKRRIAVVAAPGDDELNKGVTHLLEEVWRLQARGESFERPFEGVRQRFLEYGSQLEEKSFIDGFMSDLYRGIDQGKSREWIVSRGETTMMHIFARVAGGSPAAPENFIFLNNGTYSFIGGVPRGEVGLDIVAGNYGLNAGGNIELFPSPGGNYTASIIAAGINAEGLEIYKKEPGFLSADPHIVPNPHPIKEMTYTEMMSINYASKDPIVPARSVLAAIEGDIPIHVRSLDISEQGTTIVPKTQGRSSGDMVVGVVGKSSATSFTVTGREGIHDKEGIVAKISQTFAEEGMSINLLNTEINKVNINVDESQLREGDIKIDPEEIKEKLRNMENLKGKVKVSAKENLGTVCVVGEEIGENSIKVIKKISTALDKQNIDIVDFNHGGGKNVLFTVEESNLHNAINAVHDEFFPSRDMKQEEKE